MSSEHDKIESGVPVKPEQPAAPVPKWWLTQPPLPQRKPNSSMATARLVWAVLVGIVMVAIWLAGQESHSVDSDVRDASSTAAISNENAGGAPQQTVVNGWHQADLMEIQIRQVTYLADRASLIATLVLLAGLGLVGDAAMRADADRRAN